MSARSRYFPISCSKGNYGWACQLHGQRRFEPFLAKAYLTYSIKYKKLVVSTAYRGFIDCQWSAKRGAEFFLKQRTNLSMSGRPASQVTFLKSKGISPKLCIRFSRSFHWWVDQFSKNWLQRVELICGASQAVAQAAWRKTKWVARL